MQAMNRKLIQLVLLVCIFLGTTACGSNKSEGSRESMIEEVNNLPDAEIKIPSTLVGDELDNIPVINSTTPALEDASTDNSLNESENTEDATVNTPAADGANDTDLPEQYGQTDEDNNIAYHLDGDTRTQILNDMAADIENSIDVILADKEYYPNIADITVNKDCTEFTIYLTTDMPNLYESTLLMSFYTLGDRYQIYNGIPLEDVKTTVIYINQLTGIELARTDSTSVKN